jgi:uncharacterized protein YukJ
MPIKYGLLIGRIIEGERDDELLESPHYQIFVEIENEIHRVVINVQSKDGSEVLFFIDEKFDHPILDRMIPLNDGLHYIKKKANSLAIDYLRSGYFTKEQMVALPPSVEGENNDVQDFLDRLAKKAIQERDLGSRIYVWGAPFPNGMHDIHMNQGNSGNWKQDNAIWQDGAIIFYFPKENLYKAFFLAFQNQSWNTDNNGNPIVHR